MAMFFVFTNGTCVNELKRELNSEAIRYKNAGLGNYFRYSLFAQPGVVNFRDGQRTFQKPFFVYSIVVAEDSETPNMIEAIRDWLAGLREMLHIDWVILDREFMT